MKINIPFIVLAVVVGGLFLLCVEIPRRGLAAVGGVAYAEEGWTKEFGEVCSKTQDAMALSVDELRSLIARCDALKSRIEKLDEQHRKVAARRLQMCRDFYVFTLESKEKK